MRKIHVLGAIALVISTGGAGPANPGRSASDFAAHLRPFALRAELDAETGGVDV